MVSMLLHLMRLVFHHGSLRGHGDLRGSDRGEGFEIVQRDLTDNLGHLGQLRLMETAEPEDHWESEGWAYQ
jgi:hypothetical protein